MAPVPTAEEQTVQLVKPACLKVAGISLMAPGGTAQIVITRRWLPSVDQLRVRWRERKLCRRAR